MRRRASRTSSIVKMSSRDRVGTPQTQTLPDVSVQGVLVSPMFRSIVPVVPTRRSLSATEGKSGPLIL